MIFLYKEAAFYYERIGDGLPILMLHGLGADMELMKGCMEPVLEKNGRYQRIYFDLPGMGKSAADFRYCSADGILEVLTAFIRAEISGDFLVAGQSYGGYLARGILSAFPERTAGLLLLCPVIIPAREKRSLPQPDGQYKVIDQTFLQTLTQDEQDDLQNLVRINQSSYRRFQIEMLSSRSKANEKFIARLLQNYSFSFPLEASIGVCHKPVSFITGRQDTITGYQDVWTLLENYPRAGFAVIDTAGHGLQIDQPDLFAALVRDWLRRVEEAEG